MFRSPFYSGLSPFLAATQPSATTRVMSNRVPLSLHSEFTEYASLLRSLRTSHILDLTSHLSQYQSSTSQQSIDDHEDDPEQAGEGRVDGSFQVAHSEASSSSTRVRIDRNEPNEGTSLDPDLRSRRAPTRDTWTRWPMLSGDVQKPEWSLQDEVQHIVHTIRKNQRIQEKAAVQSDLLRQPGSSTRLNEEDDDAETLDESIFPVLTALTAEYLRALLDVCAEHIPSVAVSSRARLGALSWPGVLAAASASGIASPEAIHKVEVQLKTIYQNPEEIASSSEGMSRHLLILITCVNLVLKSVPDDRTSLAAARSRVVLKSREQLNSLLAASERNGDGDILRVVEPPLDSSLKRKRKKSKVSNG
jgi:hypothetical protein